MSHRDSAATTTSRRRFLQATAAAAGGVACWAVPGRGWAYGYRSANERPVLGYIGAGIRYGNLIHDSAPFGPCAAICDVDGAQLRKGRAQLDQVYADRGVSAPTPHLCEDYRRILDRPDIDAVVIATPDHWHVKIAAEALRAGKDVYCEKPLTLTIAEGATILGVLGATDRVMQVGTQQRSGKQFQTAAALARQERAGRVRRVTCGIGESPSSPALPAVSPPSELNWNRWLGPAPWVEYREAAENKTVGYGSEHAEGRAHAHFRWWYEYAGGKLTDWGAHHVDIAMWSLNKSDASIGRFTIDPIRVEHPVDFVDGYPVQDDRFNTATKFEIRITFEDGVELDIVDRSERLKFDNGIMYECEKGRFFINRGKLTGKPVEDLKTNPLPGEAYADLYDGLAAEAVEESHEQRSGTHMQNFFDCVKSRSTPISDVASHHRHLSVCHATNVALRLGRKLTFDPASEAFVGDDQANGFLARESRQGFEIEA